MSEIKGDITAEWKLYMYLLKCAMRAEKLDENKLGEFDRVDYNELVSRAKRNKQTMLLQNYIYEYAVFSNQEMSKPKNNIAYVVYEYEKYKCVRNVLELAQKNEIPFIVFKGCVLADLYPQYIQRKSSDTDIFVYEEYNEKAIKMLLDEGYVINEQHTKDGVTVFVHSQRPHILELHTCLWENYEGKRLEILKSFNLTDKNKLIELETCGFKVTTLGYEEHLIYQLFHIIKHFSLEGIGVKYLSDIALYVDAYGQYIDFDQFWKKMEEIDYAKFSHYVFAICIEFLGMKPDIIANRNMEMGDEMVEFMLDLFQRGTIDVGNSDRWQILGMMTPYFTGEKGTSKSKLKRKLALIFPRAKDLQDHYMYAKKCPILLPVAWVHKGLNFLIKSRSKENNWYTPTEKLDVAEHRIDLMNKMGLLG